MAKRWTQAELNDLEKKASSLTLDQLARRFRTEAETVAEKLEETGLKAALEAQGEDPSIKDFTRGVAKLHAQKWQDAAALFEKVIGETDEMQIADRARQHLAICSRNTAAPAADDDPYLLAVFEKNRGNLAEALVLCEKQGTANKEESFAYLSASICALLEDEEDQALKWLETAIELEPKNRVHAFHDSDFTALRGHEEFSRLVQAP